jgi:hypothetical protein
VTLALMIGKMRRRGVTFEIVDGEVRVHGWSLLSAAEQERLREDRENVRARLEARERRRQRRAERKRKQQEQQESKATAQQERNVIGMEVLGQGRWKPLYSDECTEIPVARCRVLTRTPYGWK